MRSSHCILALMFHDVLCTEEWQQIEENDTDIWHESLNSRKESQELAEKLKFLEKKVRTLRKKSEFCVKSLNTKKTALILTFK